MHLSIVAHGLSAWPSPGIARGKPNNSKFVTATVGHAIVNEVSTEGGIIDS
jgi:hypothetical protein